MIFELRKKKNTTLENDCRWRLENSSSIKNDIKKNT
jgi:hypothetical protein